jgi:hypothetical protein
VLDGARVAASTISFSSTASNSLVVVSNGSTLNAGTLNLYGTNNDFIVTGSATRMTVGSGVTVSFTSAGANTRWRIEEGAQVTFSNQAGIDLFGRATLAITGKKTALANVGQIGLGNSLNRLDIDGGASLSNKAVWIRNSSNRATVSGANSRWDIATLLSIGTITPFSTIQNAVRVENGATLAIGEAVFLGSNGFDVRHRITVSNATFILTNQAGNATYHLRTGTNEFRGGTMDIDQLLMRDPGTNFTAFDFSQGLLTLGSAVISNGLPFIVGDGTNLAELRFKGAGTREFNHGLIIASGPGSEHG